MVSSAYLRLLIFLPAILIQICASSSLAFYMMYSAYKLNKQGDSIQPWLYIDSFSYLEPVCCSMANSNCCFLTCIQVSQQPGSMIWYSHVFKNFLQVFVVIHTVTGDSEGKEFTCNAGDPVSIPGSGRSPGEGHGNPLQYPCLENPHGQRSLVGYSPWVTKSQTWLNDQHLHFHAVKGFSIVSEAE